MFLNNRYYDPGLSRFVSVDPLVGQTGEPFSYANGNPTTWSDPTGLDLTMPLPPPGATDYSWVIAAAGSAAGVILLNQGLNLFWNKEQTASVASLPNKITAGYQSTLPSMASVIGAAGGQIGYRPPLTTTQPYSPAGGFTTPGPIGYNPGSPAVTDTTVTRTPAAGGTWNQTRGGNGTEAHHLVSAFALAATSFGGGKWGCGQSAAPAIRMDPDDHADTGSHGHNPGSGGYRLKEAAAIGDGSGFMSAFEMGAKDVIDKFGSKYADAVDLARTAAERYFRRCGPGPGGSAA